MTRLLAILTPLIVAAVALAQGSGAADPSSLPPPPPPGYRPFIDPINLHDRWWLTLIPLAVGISFAYKAVRVKSFDGYLKQVLHMSFMVVMAMVLLAAGLYLFVELVVPSLS